MSDKLKQRYYWLKLDKTFFKEEEVAVLEGMEHGKEFVLIYLKLLCESIGHEGRLRFSNQVPYTAKMLASVLREDPKIFEKAFELFKELMLIEVEEDGTIVIPNLNKMVGSETGQAEYMRTYRSKKANEKANMVNRITDYVAGDIDVDEELLKEAYGEEWYKHI